MTELSEQPDPSRTVTVSFDLARLPSVATTLGVALVSASILLAALYAREGDHLDGSNFTMGVLATVGLLAVAAGAHLLVAHAERRANLVSWPGAGGVLGVGAMLAVYIEHGRTSTYAAGTAVLALSVLSYAATKAAPFVLTTILGLGVLYFQVFDDVIDIDSDGTNVFMIVGAGIVVFVGAVTVVGWTLPKTRVLSAVVVGTGAIVAFAFVFQALFLFSTLSAFGIGPDEVTYSGSFEQTESGPVAEDIGVESFQVPELMYEEEPGRNPYRDDVRALLSYCAALALFWSICALATGHVAFRILSVAIVVLSVPAATIVLMVNHPTWWQVALTGAGGLLFALLGLRLLKRDPAPPAI